MQVIIMKSKLFGASKAFVTFAEDSNIGKFYAQAVRGDHIVIDGVEYVVLSRQFKGSDLRIFISKT